MVGGKGGTRETEDPKTQRFGDPKARGGQSELGSAFGNYLELFQYLSWH